jgi:hypothetical protein
MPELKRAQQKYGGDLIYSHDVKQQEGMRLHYDQTLPKIAGELTGEKGEKVSFGEHKMALEQNFVGEPEPNTLVYRPRKDLIFRNEKGEPKTDVTARMFSIAKAKKDFSLYGRTGAIFPQPTPRQGPPRTLSQIAQAQRQGLVNKLIATIKTAGPKADLVARKDAADNQARIVAKQESNGVRTLASLAFKNQSSAALEAATAAVEANGDKANLDKFIAVAQAKGDKKGLAAAQFAKANWDALQPIVDRLNQEHADELAKERAIGLDVDEREGYIRHLYDLGKIPSTLIDSFLLGGRSAGGRGFMKGRVFGSLYDAIKNGYGNAIKSWNAADLLENRLRSGLQMVNDDAWLEGMKGIQDPTTHNPIVREMQKVQKPSGKTELRALAGYESWSPFIGARVFAVHRGYVGLLKNLTAGSIIENSEMFGLPLGKYALEGTGTLKHAFFLFDTFHLVRMAVKGASLGTFGHRKGVSLLEYSPKDLDAAKANGEIDQQTYDYIKSNQDKAQYLIQRGLNVGRVAEGLNSEIVRQIPIAGRFNKWVFEKVTRGIMMDAGMKEFDRYQEMGMSKEDAARKTVKYVNTYFGNLGRQGVFRNKTMQDLAKFVFLAPQWVESMARTESGAVGQALTGLAKGGQFGTLARGTAATVGALFVLTQLVNLISRQQPTWHNPEPEHKFDAWIPGGKNGFWISPLGLPMDLTHDLIRYTEGGDSPTTAISRVVGNKFSPAMRAEEVLRTGRDYTGQQLTEGQRWETAAKNLIPAPLPLQAALKGSGQFERQALASVGIKAEPANSPRTIVGNIRRQWLYKQGMAKLGENTPSEYTPLKQALEDGDITKAKQLYEQLLQQKIADDKFDSDPKNTAMKAFQKEFEISNKEADLVKERGQVDANKERAFIKTLTPHQQDLYNKVLAEQKQMSDLFFSQIQPRMSGSEPRGIRPPSIRRPRHFSY